MKKCGLLGEKVCHSFSPYIHNQLGEYEYNLFEIKPHELDSFLRSDEWDCLNVTIPYKKAAYTYADELSEDAILSGCVNTLVKDKNGKIIGDNTDVFGFSELLSHKRIRIKEKKVIILGSGGASSAVAAVLKKSGAYFTIISRNGPDNYQNIEKHFDANIIINTTPVGMYPDNANSLLSICNFTKCEHVIDLIYNPLHTKIMLDAEAQSIDTENGLYMLVAQAVKSSQRFTDSVIPSEMISSVYYSLKKAMTNIVLIGMPGCGKSTLARELSVITGKPVLDCDEEFEKVKHISPADYISTSGENAFRDAECSITSLIGKNTGHVISTGGGCILRNENYGHLHQNSIIVWLKRDLELLNREGRPLSLKADMREMYEKRRPLYEAFSDIVIENNSDIHSVAMKLLSETEALL